MKEPNLKHVTGTTQYLLDALKPDFDFIKCRATSEDDLMSVANIRAAFAVRAGRLVKELAEEIANGATFVSRQWEVRHDVSQVWRCYRCCEFHLLEYRQTVAVKRMDNTSSSTALLLNLKMKRLQINWAPLLLK